jgi:hypothetical protein
MGSTLELTVRLLGAGERERPINHRVQVVHFDGSIYRLEVGAAPHSDSAEHDAAVDRQQSGPG